MARPDELVRLAIASDEIEANIWRDALEQEGIRPLVRSRSPIASMGGGAIFETFEVLVLGRDEKRARWVLGEAMEPHEPELLPEELQEHATAD
jgi:hypothetical protein